MEHVRGGWGVWCFVLFWGFGWFGGVDLCITYHKILLRTYFYLPIPQLNSGQKSYRKPWSGAKNLGFSCKNIASFTNRPRFGPGRWIAAYRSQGAIGFSRGDTLRFNHEKQACGWVMKVMLLTSFNNQIWILITRQWNINEYHGSLMIDWLWGVYLSLVWPAHGSRFPRSSSRDTRCGRNQLPKDGIDCTYWLDMNIYEVTISNFINVKHSVLWYWDLFCSGIFAGLRIGGNSWYDLIILEVRNMCCKLMCSSLCSKQQQLFLVRVFFFCKSWMYRRGDVRDAHAGYLYSICYTA